MSYKKSILYFLAAGILWATVASLLGLVNQVQLWLQLPGPESGLGFGTLRPLYTTALIYGAGLSLFMGAAYFAVQKAENVSLKFEWLGLVSFGAIQAATVLGLLTILAGYNKGHEYGELTFVSDNLIAIGLLVFIISIVLSNARPKDSGYTPVLVAVLTTVAALLVTFLLSNIGQPTGPLSSVPLYAGYQDAALQEYSRFALLGFGILGPLLALSYFFVPHYYSVPLYSRSMSGFQILGMLVMFPLAGAAALLFSPISGPVHTMGVAAVVAGSSAAVSGALSSVYTVTKSETKLRSDSVGLFFRYGLFLLIAWAMLRAVLSLGFVQSGFGFTQLNALDISRDAQTYGLLILSGAAYVAGQSVAEKAANRTLISWHLILLVSAALIALLGDVVLGASQANAMTSVVSGKLTHPAWTQALFAGTLGDAAAAKPEFGTLFLASGHGLRLLAAALAAIGASLGALVLLPTLFGKAAGYSIPSQKAN